MLPYITNIHFRIIPGNLHLFFRTNLQKFQEIFQKMNFLEFFLELIFFAKQTSEMDSTRKNWLTGKFSWKSERFSEKNIFRKFCHLSNIWPPGDFLYSVKCRNTLIMTIKCSSWNYRMFFRSENRRHHVL